MSEQEQPVTWEGYNDWHASLTPEQKNKGRVHGQWPEKTSQVYIDLEARTTGEERLVKAVYGDQGSGPTIEEILARPADYAQRHEEEVERIYQELLKERGRAPRKLQPHRSSPLGKYL